MSDPNQPQGQPGPHGAPQQPPPGQYGPPPGQQPGQYPPPQAGYPQGGQTPVTESDERTWAMLGHLGGILIGFIAGLIVYLVYKDRSAYLRQQGAEALNFQILVGITYIVVNILGLVTLGLGYILFLVPLVAQVVFGIIAGLAANKHEDYRYPVSIRFVK